MIVKYLLILSSLLLSVQLDAMQAPEQPLRIMTFNVRRAGKESADNMQKSWTNRKPLVVAALKALQPDIFGLQEPTIEQIQDIENGLGAEYAWVGKGRGKEWWGKSEDEYNPLFYKNKRLELLDSGTFVLNPSGALNWRFLWSPRTVGLLTRISTWGKFKDRLNGQEFYVYNTHLDHKFAAAQVHGMQAICTKIGECTDKLPVILMGDFNTELTPALLEGELKDFANTKALAQNRVGPDQTRTGWDFKELKDIDHILVSKQAPVVVKEHRVVQEESRERMPSDHRPVLVDLLFIKK
ncbi:MAG: endonuclease/exonuclease/phosphatase family protein [Candidatus Babeliales bacterium]